MMAAETLPAPAAPSVVVLDEAQQCEVFDVALFDMDLRRRNAEGLLQDAYAQIATLEAKLAQAAKEEQRVYELIGRAVADIGNVLAYGTFLHRTSDGLDVEASLTDIADKLADGRVGL